MNEAFLKAFGLEGKVALITGGGTGLGFAMAKAMIDAGAEVILTGRREEVLRDACEKLGEKAQAIPFDVTHTEEAKPLLSRIIKEYGRIDVLVNNAGIHCKKPVEAVTQEDLQAVMNTHVFGAYALSQAALPYMRQQKSGSIVFVSSMSAYIGLTNVTAYSAAKSAVLGLTKTLSSEVSADGIRVNTVVPGFIDTPMFHQAVDADLPRQQKILGHTPMNRYGTPEDVAWATVYLASDASRFVTGTSLLVDGGCAIGF